MKKAFIVKAGTDNINTLDELELLCNSINIEVYDRYWQKKEPDNVFYLGKGKLLEIGEYCHSKGIKTIVFDDELTPVQLRNIEKATKLEILDRTQIILEIFANHAVTREGKLQVEIAKLQYELPRLRGKGIELSNLGAGIGTRGPGETLLEMNRRVIKERIRTLKRELEKLRKDRDTRRKRRIESGHYIISVVGYTNAGKSTLLRTLTQEDILVSNKLFSTLNPTIKRVKLPSGRFVLMSDTVGFIRKLPHTLVEAFHSTLEEITYSDIILVMNDISDPELKSKLSTTFQVLEEIVASEVKKIIVFNKIDSILSEDLEEFRMEYPDVVFISAEKRIGLDILLERIESEISKMDYTERLTIDTFHISALKKYSDQVVQRIIEESELKSVVEISGKEFVVKKIISEIKELV